MTSREKVLPFLALALTTLIVVGAMVPALPAEAASEPPFVLYFPQDPRPRSSRRPSVPRGQVVGATRATI